MEKIIRELHYEMREVPHTRFAGARDKVNVAFCNSGKLVIQGKGAKEFIEFILEPQVLMETTLGYESLSEN